MKAKLIEIKENLILESPAKVNLRLEILRKRKDGYHELRTVLQKISLHDTLYFSLTNKKGISIKTDHPDLPIGNNNLIYQAVQSILKRSDFKGGVHVKIQKRIPIGGGLGGGSSNAATTLKALNQLLSIRLSKKELMRLGVQIGADVPFFFLGGDAIGSGIGERLKRIELPRLWYVLIYPNLEVSTHWAYQNFMLTKMPFHINLHKFFKSPQNISNILLNDLEETVSKRYPQIEVMKKMLFSQNALGASMTGSGSTVFGIFSDEGSSLKAYQNIKRMVRRKGWVVFNASSIHS